MIQDKCANSLYKVICYTDIAQMQIVNSINYVVLPKLGSLKIAVFPWLL